jgi:hypothetical protein
MLAWIVKNPAWTVCAVLGLACAVLFGLERYRAARLDAAQAEVRILKGNFTTAIEANQHLSAGLDQLRGAHEELIETIRADQGTIRRAAEAVTLASAAIHGGAERVRSERENIIREPSCAELARLDVAAVCPALAISLRDQASRQGRFDD